MVIMYVSRSGVGGNRFGLFAADVPKFTRKAEEPPRKVSQSSSLSG